MLRATFYRWLWGPEVRDKSKSAVGPRDKPELSFKRVCKL